MSFGWILFVFQDIAPLTIALEAACCIPNEFNPVIRMKVIVVSLDSNA
jgi:hypothetical protein